MQQIKKQLFCILNKRFDDIINPERIDIDIQIEDKQMSINKVFEILG